MKTVLNRSIGLIFKRFRIGKYCNKSSVTNRLSVYHQWFTRNFSGFVEKSGHYLIFYVSLIKNKNNKFLYYFWNFKCLVLKIQTIESIFNKKYYLFIWKRGNLKFLAVHKKWISIVEWKINVKFHSVIWFYPSPM